VRSVGDDEKKVMTSTPVEELKQEAIELPTPKQEFVEQSQFVSIYQIKSPLRNTKEIRQVNLLLISSQDTVSKSTFWFDSRQSQVGMD